MKPKARKCEWCGKHKGVFAFRYYTPTGWKRGYFHNSCFDKFKCNGMI